MQKPPEKTRHYPKQCATTTEYQEDVSSTLTMQWKCYEKVAHGKTRQGKHRMVLRLHYKTTTARVFLDYLRPKLRAFIVHNYIAKWQEEQYKISFIKHRKRNQATQRVCLCGFGQYHLPYQLPAAHRPLP